jgi:hypothetical protein
MMLLPLCSVQVVLGPRFGEVISAPARVPGPQQGVRQLRRHIVGLFGFGSGVFASPRRSKRPKVSQSDIRRVPASFHAAADATLRDRSREPGFSGRSNLDIEIERHTPAGQWLGFVRPASTGPTP